MAVMEKGMKPEERFGLDAIERRQKILEDAQKPAAPPRDGVSQLGQLLVNLPWIMLAIAFIVWWLKK